MHAAVNAVVHAIAHAFVNAVVLVALSLRRSAALPLTPALYRFKWVFGRSAQPLCPAYRCWCSKLAALRLLAWCTAIPVFGRSAPSCAGMHSATPLWRPWVVASYLVLSGHLVVIFGARGSAHRLPKIGVLAIATFLRPACSAQTCNRYGTNGVQWCWRSVAQALGCPSA